jgi:hypothetical protein
MPLSVLFREDSAMTPIPIEIGAKGMVTVLAGLAKFGRS